MNLSHNLSSARNDVLVPNLRESKDCKSTARQMDSINVSQDYKNVGITSNRSDIHASAEK